MVGDLWRNDGGKLQCCYDDNANGTHNQAYYSSFKVKSGCDDMCLDDNDNAHITICGERYFLGNMCCPSTVTEGVGLCGGIRITAKSGHPQIDTDGNWQCCPSFAYDVVPVHGQSAREDNYRQTLCCPQTDKGYYDINLGYAKCCPGSEQTFLENKVDGVQGYEYYRAGVSARHCCPVGTDAYWNGYSVGCCDTTTEKRTSISLTNPGGTYIGGPAICKNKLVENYDRSGNKIGMACVPTCTPDGGSCSHYADDEIYYSDICSSISGYTVIGAIEGSPCGGISGAKETVTGTLYTNGTQTISQSYAFQKNGGEMYCAVSYDWDGGPMWDVEERCYYEGVGKYCCTPTSNGSPICCNDCWTANVGDPRPQ